MFESYKKGKIKMTFENGVAVSIIFDSGSYTDNNMDMTDIMDDPLNTKPTTSKTAEVMITNDPTGKVLTYMEHHFKNNPAGYLSSADVVDILSFAKECTINEN